MQYQHPTIPDVLFATTRTTTRWAAAFEKMRIQSSFIVLRLIQYQKPVNLNSWDRSCSLRHRSSVPNGKKIPTSKSSEDLVQCEKSNPPLRNLWLLTVQFCRQTWHYVVVGSWFITKSIQLSEMLKSKPENSRALSSSVPGPERERALSVIFNGLMRDWARHEREALEVENYMQLTRGVPVSKKIRKIDFTYFRGQHSADTDQHPRQLLNWATSGHFKGTSLKNHVDKLTWIRCAP